MLSRDYRTLRFWDIMMSSRPIKAYTINEGLRSKLCDLCAPLGSGALPLSEPTGCGPTAERSSQPRGPRRRRRMDSSSSTDARTSGSCSARLLNPAGPIQDTPIVHKLRRVLRGTQGPQPRRPHGSGAWPRRAHSRGMGEAQ